MPAHAPARFSLRRAAAEAAAPPPLSRAATVLEAALHLSAAAAALPYAREVDEAQLLSHARQLSSVAVTGARRGLLNGLDVWPGGHRVVRGGLRAAGEILREQGMGRVEVEELPSGGGSRLALALNITRQHMAMRSGGSGGRVGAAELLSPPTSLLQSSRLALAAATEWAAALAELERRVAAEGPPQKRARDADGALGGTSAATQAHKQPRSATADAVGSLDAAATAAAAEVSAAAVAEADEEAAAAAAVASLTAATMTTRGAAAVSVSASAAGPTATATSMAALRARRTCALCGREAGAGAAEGRPCGLVCAPCNIRRPCTCALVSGPAACSACTESLRMRPAS